jgi:hypothetical protein
MPYRSISRYDRPPRIVVSGILELPFGRGRTFAAGIPQALDHVIGGWQLNGVVTKQSGPPLAFGDVIFRGNIKDIPLPKSERSVDRWFNTSGFERRPTQQLEYNVRTFPRYLAGVRADGALVAILLQDGDRPVDTGAATAWLNLHRSLFIRAYPRAGIQAGAAPGAIVLAPLSATPRTDGVLRFLPVRFGGHRGIVLVP